MDEEEERKQKLREAGKASVSIVVIDGSLFAGGSTVSKASLNSANSVILFVNGAN